VVVIVVAVIVLRYPYLLGICVARPAQAFPIGDVELEVMDIISGII
jgi:hypothetical protein